MPGRALREAANTVQDSLSGLIADVANRRDSSLTPKDVLRHLRAWDFSDALIARVRALMDSCDAARYGGTSDSRSLDEEAEEVLEAVTEALRTQKRLR